MPPSAGRGLSSGLQRRPCGGRPRCGRRHALLARWRAAPSSRGCQMAGLVPRAFSKGARHDPPLPPGRAAHARARRSFGDRHSRLARAGFALNRPASGDTGDEAPESCRRTAAFRRRPGRHTVRLLSASHGHDHEAPHPPRRHSGIGSSPVRLRQMRQFRSALRHRQLRWHPLRQMTPPRRELRPRNEP